MRSCSGSLIMLPGLRDDWAHCRQQWQWVPLLLKRVIQSLRGHCRLYSAGTYRPHTLRHSDTAAPYTVDTDDLEGRSAVLLFTSVERRQWPDQDTLRPRMQSKSLSLHTITNMSPDPSLHSTPTAFMVAVSKHAIHMINVGNLCPFWILSISSCCIGFPLPVWYAAEWC